VDIPAAGAEGPICVIGGVSSGWSLYMKNQRLVHCYNNNGDLYYVRSAEDVPIGTKVKLRFDFEKTGKEKYGAGGIGRLYMNDEKVGEGEIQHTVRFIYSLDHHDTRRFSCFESSA
jgi:hypothetical protein